MSDTCKYKSIIKLRVNQQLKLKMRLMGYFCSLLVLLVLLDQLANELFRQPICMSFSMDVRCVPAEQTQNRMHNRNWDKFVQLFDCADIKFQLIYFIGVM